jgi:anion-transporting  ArsA/GET3 family ATPase
VEDTIEFFRSISGLEAGLRTRAAEMSALLRADHTAFVLVSSPRAEAIDEAGFLATALHEGGFRLGGVVVNLVHPMPPTLHLADDALEAIEATAGPLAAQIAYHRELTALAEGERREIESLIALADGAPVCEVPLLDHDVHDVDALIELGGVLVD